MSNIYPSIIISGFEELSRTCNLEITIHFPVTQVTENTIADVSDICFSFASAGKFGAYAIAGNSKIGTAIAYDGKVFAHNNSITVEFITTNINYKAFQFFRNMLMLLQEKDVAISSIGVIVHDYHGNQTIRLPEITDINESEEYLNVVITPDISEFIWGNSEFSKTRRVLIEFHESLTKEQFLTLCIYTDAWYLLLEKGAFSSPFGLPLETQSLRGMASLFDEVTYEISISRYISSEVGFKVLANMLKHFSRNVFPITKVEID